MRFRDPPASPTRVGGATRPLRCPLRGRIGSLAPGARGLGWRKSGPVKVFCPAFLQKSGRGPGAAPLAARRSARNTPSPKKRRRGSKGEPSPGVPPLRAAPAARSLTHLHNAGGERAPGGGGTPPLRGLAERGGAGGGRRKGSSRTPTPTAGGRRAVRRGIYCESIPCPGEGRRNVVRLACTVTAGRRGRRPLQGWCDAVGSALTVTAGRLRDGPRNWVEALRPGPSSNTHQSRSRHSWRSPPGCRQRLRCRRRLRPRDRGLLCGPRP